MEGKFSDLTAERLGELVNEYPWFDIPFFLCGSTEDPLPRRIALQTIWRSRTCIHEADEIVEADGVAPKRGNEDRMLAIIEEFLSGGEHRITAKEGTPEELPQSDDKGLLPDELLTEELASIYLVQGLTTQAVEIYRRLSLLNPEKSVYFAEIIEKAQAAEAADSDSIK